MDRQSDGIMLSCRGGVTSADWGGAVAAWLGLDLFEETTEIPYVEHNRVSGARIGLSVLKL